VDSAVDTAPWLKLRVSSIDNGIYLKCGDVGEN
jgi:hypothetical protein